ncbi:MAG: P22 phage major capsid protein family protein [Eubacteriales bacterium]|nr:P22 phage major capsid protein family protein [Eubacteriales bacterium]
MGYEDASTGNTLTNLIPDLYLALDTVSRELTGMIPSVMIDPRVARAAIGQTIHSPVAPAGTAGDVAPAPVPPDDGEQAIGNISLAITKSRYVPVRWQGEESLQINNGGVGVGTIRSQQFAQAMRTLVNEIESDLCGLYVNASRAVVPNDTTLFKTNLADVANVRKILVDNGAPTSDLQCVIDTAAGAALRTQANLTTVPASGQSMLDQGVLISPYGVKVRESAQIKTPAAGTADSATLDTTDYAVGDTAMTLAAAGTGTILAGDLVTIANTGDTTTQYVNKTLISAVSGSAFTINAPGLRKAITANNCAIAVRASGSRCLAFDRSAIILATRMPALPEEGDMAADRTTITDPRTGLSFEVAMYKQYRQVRYEVAIAWGVKAVKEEHIAILAGA